MLKFSIQNVIVLTSLLGASLAQAAPYDLTQAQSGTHPFATGVVSTEAFEINTVFNQQGDKVLFSRCNDEFNFCQMMESEFSQGQWQDATTLSFSGQYFEGDPYYTSDYAKVFFISRRPIDGGNKASENFNMWYAKRTDKGWQAPVYVPSVSSAAHDLYPSLTDDGRLFFLSFRDDSRHMYMANPDGEGFSSVQRLPEHIYGKNGLVGDSMVTRDGKHIIFSISNREDSKGRGDLYISHLKDGRWSVAKSLGDKVNSADHEFTPILSPDNRYLFFTRIENGKGNLYQIAVSELGINL